MNRRGCLEEATKAVCFTRHADYGDPTYCFGRIAALWSIMGFRHNGETVTGEDVALAMILLKIARQGHSSKPDNWIDIAGYAACGAELCGKIDQEAADAVEAAEDADQG